MQVSGFKKMIYYPIDYILTENVASKDKKKILSCRKWVFLPVVRIEKFENDDVEFLLCNVREVLVEIKGDELTHHRLLNF